MTVASATNRIEYMGTGTLVYAYPFYIFADTDLKVYVDTVLQTLTTNYTVSGAGTPSGGNVTFIASVNGKAIVIKREVPLTQLTDYVANDSFPAETHEAALDKLTMECQQNNEAIGRAIKFSQSSTYDNIEMADPAGSKYLRMNAGNTAAEWVDADPNVTATLATLLSVEDSRTNTVAVIATHKATTTGSPAAGIGIGELFQAESADESPSDFGRIEFVASDVTAGSEDTYFQVLCRVAGAALSQAYRFVVTSAFKAIFTHANTADRTYTLPDASGTVALITMTKKVGSGVGNYTRTSSAFGDADGTNLIYTITVPVGWKMSVIATFNGAVNNLTTAIQTRLFDTQGSAVLDFRQENPQIINVFQNIVLLGLITGDGLSHTVSLQYASTDNVNQAIIMNGASDNPKILFTLTPAS